MIYEIRHPMGLRCPVPHQTPNRFAGTSHVTRVNESCHTCERIMSRMRVNKSCHTYESVRSRIRKSHVTHMKASCHAHECQTHQLNITYDELYIYTHMMSYIYTHTYDELYVYTHMSHKWIARFMVSFAEYRLFYRLLLQKRPIILWILLTKASPSTSNPD